MRLLTVAVACAAVPTVLGGCGTAKLYQGDKAPTELAIIRGDLKVPAYEDGQVLLEAVDGNPIGANANRASVSPGQHTVTARCRIPSKQIANSNELDFYAYAAHIYKLEMRESDNGCRSVVVDLATDRQVAP